MRQGPGGRYEYLMKAAADLNTLADVGRWSPGLSPAYVVGVVALITNDIAATGAVSFDKRPTFGSDTGRGSGDVAVLNLTTAHTGGKAVYKLPTPILIKPGEEVVAEVTDVTGAADTADIIIVLAPTSEQPANVTAMVAST